MHGKTPQHTETASPDQITTATATATTTTTAATVDVRNVFPLFGPTMPGTPYAA